MRRRWPMANRSTPNRAVLRKQRFPGSLRIAPNWRGFVHAFCLCKLSAGLQGSFRRTYLCLVKSRFPTAETDFGRDSVHRKAASVAACPLGKLYAGTMCSGVFVVEDIESRQADVRNFFFTKSNYRCRVLRRRIAWRTIGCPGCARQRQRPSDSQYRYGFRPTPSLRSCFACDVL